MQTPSLLAALRTIVAGGNKPAGDLNFCSGSTVDRNLQQPEPEADCAALSCSRITASWLIASQLLTHINCA